ncbi:AI-2E family transporter [Chelatococcus reniformis]|uniref:AI-2E family transporter n=1 Tax=Chelatococcus reniformis TaxID=1494448 RepID=A0A916XJX8_9HYPH|nr:AI-2E family transporter [Chelatococcus reniformis]GGC76786.1 AI-2E family transporter [Chelatococcus reniformis]
MDGREIRILLGICTAILAAAALHLARSVTIPVTFALFVIALVWPLQALLQARVAKLPAMVITLVVTIATVGALGYLILWGFSQAGHWLVANGGRFQALYSEAAAWLEGHGLYAAGTLAESFNVSWLLRIFQGVATRLNGIVAFAVLTLIFVMLGLLEVDILQRKLTRAAPGTAGERLLAASTSIARKLRTYMVVRTVMSVLTGLAVWGLTAILGLELALAWGVMAFALNYIPFVGPLAATLLPTVFALAQFGSWQLATTVFVGMNVIQFFSGSYIEPRVAGNALAISPFIVLLAVFFWSFMWGIPGAFIGIPVTIALLTVCEQIPSSRWAADLLSGRADPA